MSRLIFTILTVVSFFLSFFMNPTASLALHSQNAVIHQISGSLQGGTDFEAAHPLPEFQDNGLLYITLTAEAPTHVLNKFFVIRDGCTSPKPGSYDLEVGYKYGPFAIAAGKFSLGVQNQSHEIWNYSFKVEYYKQLATGDTEPNDNYSEGTNIGQLQNNSVVSGHSGYMACIYDEYDNFSFQVSDSGDYYFDTYYDPSFSERTGCRVVFILKEERAGLYRILDTFDGGSGTRFGPEQLDVGKKYWWTITHNGKCTIYDGEIKTIGGSYKVTLVDKNNIDVRISLLQLSESVLYCGEGLQIKVDVESFVVSSVANLKLKLYIYKAADTNFTDSIQKFWDFDLAPWDTKPFAWDATSELVDKNWNMEPGKYSVYARLARYDSNGALLEILDNEVVGFEVVCYDHKVMPFILLLLTK